MFNKRFEMHPRNFYKIPPDYTALAIKYPQFRKICNLGLNGKVLLNFKAKHTLEILTQTLLLENFHLKVEFAPNSLVPTIPSRLNYILWIEDIMNMFGLEPIRGIDIGCGSSCIYSLIAAKKNDWKMIALETDATNIQFARENVKRNNIDHLIDVFQQNDSTVIFEQLFKTLNNDFIYEFCLCNPPFFDSKEISSGKEKRANRTSKRKEPSNSLTGSLSELYCEGGELAFVTRVIDESVKFKLKIRIFTTMLGQKSSLISVLEIMKARNISNVTQTKFYQGKTTRWAVAWSFYENYDLTKFIPL